MFKVIIFNISNVFIKLLTVLFVKRKTPRNHCSKLYIVPDRKILLLFTNCDW